MKRLIKLPLLLLITVSCLLVFAAQMAVAQDLAHRQQVVCSALSERTAGIIYSFDERTAKLKDAKQNQQQKTEARRTAADDEIALSRGASDKRQKDVFEAIKQRAQTDDQLQVLEKYQSAVIESVSQRRAAYDEAKTLFRQQMDTFITNRQQATEAALETFRSGATTALAKAEESCEERQPELGQIRATLVKELKSARAEYAEFRRQNPSSAVEESLQTFAVERDASLKAARAKFEQSMAAARNEFTPDIQSEDAL